MRILFSENQRSSVTIESNSVRARPSFTSHKFTMPNTSSHYQRQCKMVKAISRKKKQINSKKKKKNWHDIFQSPTSRSYFPFVCLFMLLSLRRVPPRTEPPARRSASPSRASALSNFVCTFISGFSLAIYVFVFYTSPAIVSAKATRSKGMSRK